MAEKTVKQNGVIWFDKTGLSIYLEDKPFLRLNFTPDVFSNLEIVDKTKLENLARQFIKQSNLSYLTFILIMTSDVLFEKDWILPQSELQKKEEIDFIENIPFENTISHSWTKDNKKKLIAGNMDSIVFLEYIFEKDNGHMVGVFPYSIFGANIRNESVKEIWKKLGSLKLDNLIEINKTQLSNKPELNSHNNVSKDKALLPFLILIFVVLISLLIFLMIRK